MDCGAHTVGHPDQQLFMDLAITSGTADRLEHALLFVESDKRPGQRLVQVHPAANALDGAIVVSPGGRPAAGGTPVSRAKGTDPATAQAYEPAGQTLPGHSGRRVEMDHNLQQSRPVERVQCPGLLRTAWIAFDD